eukprot:634_1
MRRACVSATVATLSTVRFQSAKRYDLFGYEVDTNTAPWIAKIKAVKTYDEAGEVLVDMNVKNCPPDLTTYNATLECIHTSPSKSTEPVDNESKFCAMMDLLEEMDHRNKIKPDVESWKWVMKECAASGSFRLGYAVERVMQQNFGGAPADLAAANENNAAKAKADDKEHPAHLTKQFGLFDIEIK